MEGRARLVCGSRASVGPSCLLTLQLLPAPVSESVKLLESSKSFYCRSHGGRRGWNEAGGENSSFPSCLESVDCLE